MSFRPRGRLSSARPRVARLIVPLLGTLGTGCEPEEDLGNALYRLNKDPPPTQQVPQPPLLPLPESCFPVNPECDADTSDVYPFLARDAPDLPLPELRCARSPSEPTIQELGVYGEPLLCGYTDGSIQTLIRYTYRAIDDCPRPRSVVYEFLWTGVRIGYEGWDYDRNGRLKEHWKGDLEPDYGDPSYTETWTYDQDERTILWRYVVNGQSNWDCTWDVMPSDVQSITTYDPNGLAILSQTGQRQFIDPDHYWACSHDEWLRYTAMVWDDPEIVQSFCVDAP